ncbi:MAG: hypothetical protein L0Z62_10575 [Gemmataceae bacterium]|nr:hypothetical protein [Gemmataceae bacterium]
MATATPPRTFNRDEAQRRVRHPLQAVRGTIRRYVALDGAAAGILFIAICFWLGLALDWGLFALLRFDWIKEVDRTSGGLDASSWLRLGILAVFVACLIAVVSLKVVRRLFREFSDAALALVLERRFPRELGDRLITAVEMADPELCRKYGFSQAMLDRTISEAADRVERLPVHEVFNWARLRWHLILAGLATVGVYLLVGIVSCIISAATGQGGSPLGYFWDFNHVSGTWFQRNVLIQDRRYWLGNEYLELVRFPESRKRDDGVFELRVARDEFRPDVWVRAVKWIYADRGAPEGWRSLRWTDLPDLLDSASLEVNVPASWPHWVIDLDDLDPSIPAGVIPADWGWQNKTSGFIRPDLNKKREVLRIQSKFLDSHEMALTAQEEREKKVKNAQALQDIAKEREELTQARSALNQSLQGLDAVERLFDWRNWTVDRLELQLKRKDVRDALKLQHESGYNALDNVLKALAELADSPRMRGTMRMLSVPELVTVEHRGKNTKNSSPLTKQEGNKYSFGLNDLKESITFTVSGDEYTTPARGITLVPPPAVVRLSIDKEEPAYMHYRLLGEKGDRLRGLRQVFRDVPLSTTGTKTIINVPFGTSVTVTATTERPLREGVRVAEPAKRDEAGSLTPNVPVRLMDDRKTFEASFRTVVKTIEFDFEYRDEDNVRGRRHIVIKPADDQAPKLLGVGIAVALRPDIDPETGKGPASKSGERLLITPRARIPWKGILSDDRGLARVEFLYSVKELEFQRLGADPKEKPPVLELEGNPLTRRMGLVVSTFQYMPGMPGFQWFAPAYLGGISAVASGDLARPKSEPESGQIELTHLQRLLNQRLAGDVTFEEVGRLLQIQPRNRPLALELLGLKGEVEQEAFVKRLQALNQLDALLIDTLHFIKLGPEQRNTLLGQVKTQPQAVIQGILDATAREKDETELARELLKRDPEAALLKEYQLENEGRVRFDEERRKWFYEGVGGFDVGAFLPRLLAPGNKEQKHYELHVSIAATDNNVETGPTKGPVRGPFVFLVVSENELLTEISKQERRLWLLLNEAIEELDRRKTHLAAEVSKFEVPMPDLNHIAVRADQARKAVRDTGDVARAVLERYNGIVVEMLVNRIEGHNQLGKIEEQVTGPLHDMLRKNEGAFAETDQSVTRLWQNVDQDATALKNAEAGGKKPSEDLLKKLDANRFFHKEDAKTALKRLEELIERLKAVRDAIQDAGEFPRIVAMLVQVEAQRREYQRVYEQRLKKLIDELFGEK